MNAHENATRYMYTGMQKSKEDRHRNTETADIICAERPCEVRSYAGRKAESLYRELYGVYEKSDRWNPEEMAAVDYGEPGTDYYTERYAYNHRGQLTCVMPDGVTGTLCALHLVQILHKL